MSNVPKGITASDLPPLQYFFVNNGPCPQGPQGPTGPTGPRGYDGLGQGATGATGASGPPGTVGATGPQGAIGATGAQGGPGAPFLGGGQTGLAGPQGATGVRGVAGGVTISGDPYGVVVGNSTNVGVANAGLRYSNSKLSVGGDMFTDTTQWKSPFGVPQTASASGTNASAPLPSSALISLSLNIVNPSTGYSLLDYPAIMVVANMQTRNTQTNVGLDPPSVLNCTNFFINDIQVGNMTSFGTQLAGQYLYQTRQFFAVLQKANNQFGPGLASNVQLTCSLQSAGANSAGTALGTWTANMTVFGLY